MFAGGIKLVHADGGDDERRWPQPLPSWFVLFTLEWVEVLRCGIGVILQPGS